MTNAAAVERFACRDRAGMNRPVLIAAFLVLLCSTLVIVVMGKYQWVLFLIYAVSVILISLQCR